MTSRHIIILFKTQIELYESPYFERSRQTAGKSPQTFKQFSKTIRPKKDHLLHIIETELLLLTWAFFHTCPGINIPERMQKLS